MKDLMPVLDDLEQRLDRIDGRTVTVVRGGRDRDIEELAEKVAHELGKRLRREGLQ